MSQFVKRLLSAWLPAILSFVCTYSYASMLHEAARVGNVELVQNLLEESSLDPNDRDEREATPLFYAVTTGNATAAIVLLRGGADANLPMRGKRGLSCFQSAIGMGSESLLSACAAHGAIVESPTSLHLAAISGHRTSIDFILANGIDINAKDTHGNTALSSACNTGHRSMIQYLLQCGAMVNPATSPQEVRNSPVWRLVLSGEDPESTLELLNLLVAHGADLSRRENQGASALHIAAVLGKKKICRYLVERGLQTTAKTWDGETPGSSAAKFGYREIAEMLGAGTVK